MADEAQSAAKTETVIVDLGRQKPRKIKQLRKGKGALIDDVQAAIDDLRSSGAIPADSTPVVVVVREKRPPLWGVRS